MSATLIVIVVLITVSILALVKYMARQKHRRFLNPLRVHLDGDAGDLELRWFRGVQTNLTGLYRGRWVQFHLAERSGAQEYNRGTPPRFQVSLATSALLFFEVQDKAHLGFLKWLKWSVAPRAVSTLQVGDPDLDDRFLFQFRSTDSPEDEMWSRKLLEWTKQPEVRGALHSLHSYDVRRITMTPTLQRELKYETANNPEAQVLVLTFEPYRKETLDVGRVKVILETMESLARSLESVSNPSSAA